MFTNKKNNLNKQLFRTHLELANIWGNKWQYMEHVINYKKHTLPCIVSCVWSLGKRNVQVSVIYNITGMSPLKISLQHPHAFSWGAKGQIYPYLNRGEIASRSGTC